MHRLNCSSRDIVLRCDDVCAMCVGPPLPPPRPPYLPLPRGPGAAPVGAGTTPGPPHIPNMRQISWGGGPCSALILFLEPRVPAHRSLLNLGPEPEPTTAATRAKPFITKLSTSPCVKSGWAFPLNLSTTFCAHAQDLHRISCRHPYQQFSALPCSSPFSTHAVPAVPDLTLRIVKLRN